MFKLRLPPQRIKKSIRHDLARLRLRRESLRAAARQQNRAIALEQFLRRQDRIPNRLGRRDGAGRKIGAAHDAGVEFMLAVAVEDGSDAGVEEGNFLHDAAALGGDVGAGAAFVEHALTGG